MTLPHGHPVCRPRDSRRVPSHRSCVLLSACLVAVLAAGGALRAASPAASLALDPSRIAPAAGVRVIRGAAPDGTDALVFDGTSETGVPFPVSADEQKILAGDEISVSLWVRVDRISESSIGLGYRIPQHRQPQQAPLLLEARTVATAFGTYNLYSPVEQPLATGAWHHVAFTYSLSNLTYASYYDGIPQRAGAVSADLPAPLSVPGLLGPLGAGRFTGAIGSARVWNQALPADEFLRFQPSPAAARALAAPLAAAAADTPHAPFRRWCTALAAEATGGQPVSLRRWQFIARLVRDLPTLSSWARALSTGTLAGAPFLATSIYPYSHEKRLPFRLPHDGAPTDALVTALARGEYESVSFMFHPLQNVAKLELKASPLRSEAGVTLPAGSLDIRIVKCWFNPASGWNTYFAGGREFPTLAPELLLYDDALVKVDIDNRANFLRVDYRSGSRYVNISRAGTPSDIPPFNYVRDPVADAPGPLPLPLPLAEGHNQQFWVTLHAPSNAVPGIYTSEIAFTADGAAAGTLRLAATVHPFALPRPMTRYNLTREYLGAFMNHCQLGSQADLGKSLAHAEKRFLAEMRNMAAHNMLHPFMSGFDRESDDELSIRQFQLMREAGMPLQPVFGGTGFDPGWMGWAREGGSPDKDPEAYARFRQDFEKRIIRAASRFDEILGHRDVYFYGLDEAGPGTVRQEFAFFSILHKYGFKAFITSGVAAYANFVVDANDVPAHIDEAEAQRWHLGGARLFSYACPFTGPENPEVWRRTKGLRMYMANYDGIAEYVWYEGHHIWNDFVAAGRYKNFNIVYPTRDGVIDTVAWEALREAFDDVRYATLLKQLAAAAMASADPATATLGREHLFWLESTDPETVDLDAFRESAASRIATLARRLPGFCAPAAPRARFALPASLPATAATPVLANTPDGARISDADAKLLAAVLADSARDEALHGRERLRQSYLETLGKLAGDAARAQLLVPLGTLEVQLGDTPAALEHWRSVADAPAASTTNRLQAIGNIIAHDPVGPRVASYVTLARSLPGVATGDLLEINLALAKKRQSQNFHDQAIPPLLEAAATQGIGKSRRTRILLDLAGTYRLLGNDQEAGRIYREIMAGGDSPALVYEASRGMIETVVTPTEYDWVPTRAALDEALAVYDNVRKGNRLSRQANADLVALMAPAFIAAGKPQVVIELGEPLVAAGAGQPLKGRDAARLLENLGEAYVALKQYAKAVSCFERVEPAGQFRLLEKIGDNARKARNFRRAQQAYADMIPMIDKKESPSLYNRISRYVVQLTKATRESTTPTTQEVFDSPGDLGTLNLDE